MRKILLLILSLSFISLLSGCIWLLPLEPTYITIKFDSNGGIGEMKEIETLAFEMYSIPELEFTHDTKVFVGWGENDKDPSDFLIVKDSFMPMKDTTLYAIWRDTFEYELVDEEYRLKSYNGDDVKITIPSTFKDKPVTSIKEGALNNNVEEITIPSTFNDISDNSFKSAASLKVVNLPDSVTSIGNKAFQFCSYLESINLEKVTSIGYSAFEYCSGLSEIQLPNIETIGYEAFAKCLNLKKVVLSTKIEILQDGSFNGCFSLKYINLENIKEIKKDVFKSCIALEVVDLPLSVEQIHSSSFSNTGSITFNIKAESKPNGWQVFWDDNDVLNYGV